MGSSTAAPFGSAPRPTASQENPTEALFGGSCGRQVRGPPFAGKYDSTNKKMSAFPGKEASSQNVVSLTSVTLPQESMSGEHEAGPHATDKNSEYHSNSNEEDYDDETAAVTTTSTTATAPIDEKVATVRLSGDNKVKDETCPVEGGIHVRSGEMQQNQMLARSSEQGCNSDIVSQNGCADDMGGDTARREDERFESKDVQAETVEQCCAESQTSAEASGQREAGMLTADSLWARIGNQASIESLRRALYELMSIGWSDSRLVVIERAAHCKEVVIRRYNAIAVECYRIAEPLNRQGKQYVKRREEAIRRTLNAVASRIGVSATLELYQLMMNDGVYEAGKYLLVRVRRMAVDYRLLVQMRFEWAWNTLGSFIAAAPKRLQDVFEHIRCSAEAIASNTVNHVARVRQLCVRMLSFPIDMYKEFCVNVEQAFATLKNSSSKVANYVHMTTALFMKLVSRFIAVARDPQMTLTEAITVLCGFREAILNHLKALKSKQMLRLQRLRQMPHHIREELNGKVLQLSSEAMDRIQQIISSSPIIDQMFSTMLAKISR